MVCVPLLPKFTPHLCVTQGNVRWVVSLHSQCCCGCGLSPLSAQRVCPRIVPAAGTPVAPAGASARGSAGARSKPPLRTSAAALIVVLRFLVLAVRQRSAWRFVLSGLSSVNAVSGKLTRVSIL